MPDFRTDVEKAKEIIGLFGVLKQLRQPYESQIDEVIKFVNHSRRKITDRDSMKGQKTGVDVYDGTAISAKNILRDGLCGNTASISFRWFEYALPGKFNFPRTSAMRRWEGKRMDEYPEVKQWLQDCEDVVYAAFLRSNFYDILPEFIDDGISIGTVTMLIEDDLTKDRIIFTVPHFRECYFAENRYGMVDTLFRWYKLSLRQFADKFGFDQCKRVWPTFENMMKANPYAEREALHATFPRQDVSPYRFDKKNMPVASFWIPLEKPSIILEESGYEELPTVTWRWRKNNDEICGRSPAWDAYVEIMKANQQSRSNLIAGQKAVEPPMALPENMRGKMHDEPKGQTYVMNMERDMPKPLLQNIQLPYGIEQQERSDKVIREHFHTDFFLMLYQAAFNKVEMTATQAIGMQAEQAAVLGVRIGRLNSEAYNPIQDRMFAIEDRHGRIPEPPAILMGQGGGKIEIDYVGPLAQSQKRLFKYRNIQAGLVFLSGMKEVAPEAIDRVNIDQTVDEALDSINWPANCLNSDEKVEAIRKERQAQKAMEQTIQAGGEVAKAAQRLTRTVEPGSMIDQLTGGGAGNA